MWIFPSTQKLIRIPATVADTSIVEVKAPAGYLLDSTPMEC